MVTSARLSAWRAVDRVRFRVSAPVTGRLVCREPCRWLFRHALLGLAAGLLTCCAANGPLPAPQTSAARASPQRLEAPPAPSTTPRPARKPAAPAPAGNLESSPGDVFSASAGPKAEEALGTSPTPPDLAGLSTSPGPASPPPAQAELIGLDENAATRLLGPATEKSEQPPATVWHYKSPRCELDLFFYLDLRSGRMRTLHYTLKGEGADATRRQDCLRSLSASRER